MRRKKNKNTHLNGVSPDLQRKLDAALRRSDACKSRFDDILRAVDELAIQATHEDAVGEDVHDDIIQAIREVRALADPEAA